MVSYLNTIHDTESRFCSPEVFHRLTGSTLVRQFIEDYRKGNPSTKQMLPTFMFQGYDPNVLMGKTGSRRAKDLKATGLFMMDFDHIEEPAKLYQNFVVKCPDLFAADSVALAHITPSGKGLRLVMELPAGKTIEEAQADIEQKLQVKMDSVVKDLSRQSFCPMASDILYINEELLFKTPEYNNDTTRTENNAGCSAGNDHAARLPERTDDTSGSSGEGNVLRAANAFNPCYRGIPYPRIVEELITIYGGMPEVGNRENTLFRLASDMAKITDRSAPWLESLLPTFGLPEAEWRATIAQVCRKPIERSLGKNMEEALRRCRRSDDYEDGDISIDEYRDNFPKKAPKLIQLLTSRCMPHMKAALSQLCFPALAAHVSNHKFLMADKSKQELGIMAVLVGKTSNGKSCIDEPIRLITADIVATDGINRKREKEYNEAQRNRKANERGVKRPDDLIIRCIGGNVSNPSLLQLLTAAEEGDKEHPNQCLYSRVEEIDLLYKMASDQGKVGVGKLIRAAFDRANLDSNRSTPGAVNAYTPARWNFSAATTPDGARNFFSGKLLTDGTLSRVAFVQLPEVDIPSNDFSFGDYDEDFIKQLAFYVNNLNNYKHPTDEKGQAIPVFIKEANDLRRKINDTIDIEKLIYPDKDTYTAYAYRTRDIVVREAITCYIANGCVWEDCDDYWQWVYAQQMDTKLTMFGEKAADKLRVERPLGSGRQLALIHMPRVFAFEEFADFCQKNSSVGKNTRRLLSKYKRDGLVTEADGRYVIADKVCEKYGIV